MRKTPTTVPRPVKRWALKRWQAETAGGGRRGADRHATPGRDAILIDTDALGAESCDLLALAHAAGRAGVLERFFESDETHDGQEWYDALPQVTAMAVEWQETVGASRRRDCGEKPAVRIADCRASTLAVALRIRKTGKETEGEMRVAADVAVANPGETWPEDAVLLAAGARLEPDELARLLADACHVPNEPSWETDSVQRQREECIERHFAIACRLLLPADEAARRTMDDLVRRHLGELVR